MVEHVTVNHGVVGSSPTRGAKASQPTGFFYFRNPGAMFYTYVLYSAGFNRLYIGQSHDPNMRLDYHNSGSEFSTKPYIPWILLHTETFESRWEAMKRERELKTSAGRRWKLQPTEGNRKNHLQPVFRLAANLNSTGTQSGLFRSFT